MIWIIWALEGLSGFLFRKNGPYDLPEDRNTEDHGRYYGEGDRDQQAQFENDIKQRDQDSAYDYRQTTYGEIFRFYHVSLLFAYRSGQ